MQTTFNNSSSILKSHIYKQILLLVVFLNLFLFSTTTLFAEENKSDTKPSKDKETIISENTKETQKPISTPERTTESNPKLDSETLNDILEKPQEQSMQDDAKEDTHQILQLLKRFDFYNTGNPLELIEYVNFKEDVQQDNQSLIGLKDPKSLSISPLLPLHQLTIQSPYSELTIQRVELKDINLDKRMDFILYLNITDETFEQKLLAYIFINTGSTFSAISPALEEGSFVIKAPLIERLSPLLASESSENYDTPFESTYESTDPNKTWIDLYAIKGNQLKQVNTAHKAFFRKKLHYSERALSNLYQKVQRYRLNPKNIERGQLELQDIFGKILMHKVIVQRCQSIILPAK